jgi:hypothetical protein
MIKQNRSTFAVTALAMVVALGTAMTPTTAVAAGSIKAAYVETVIPSKPYTFNIWVDSEPLPTTFGPFTGVLGISSLTITNYGAMAQQASIYIAPTYFPDATSCSTSVKNYGSPLMTLIVQGNSTLHVPFPSPLVINSVASGHTCMGTLISGLGGAVEIVVNGILN